MIWGGRKQEGPLWRRVFAWWPVKLNDDRWAWMQTVEARFFGGLGGGVIVYREIR